MKFHGSRLASRLFSSKVQGKPAVAWKARHDGMVLYQTPVLKNAIHGVQVRIRSKGKPVALDAFRALVVG